MKRYNININNNQQPAGSNNNVDFPRQSQIYLFQKTCSRDSDEVIELNRLRGSVGAGEDDEDSAR